MVGGNHAKHRPPCPVIQTSCTQYARCRCTAEPPAHDDPMSGMRLSSIAPARAGWSGGDNRSTPAVCIKNPPCEACLRSREGKAKSNSVSPRRSNFEIQPLRGATIICKKRDGPLIGAAIVRQKRDGTPIASSSWPRSYAENGIERSSEARSDVNSSRDAHVDLLFHIGLLQCAVFFVLRV